MSPAYLPFRDGQWHLAMGLKPLQLKDWIEVGEDLVQQLEAKKCLFATRYPEVFAALPNSELGQQEVLELLLDHLPRYFPKQYQQQGEYFLNRVTGEVWNLSEVGHPLDLAGRLVQEDLCLMLPGETSYILAAASLCFPSRWRLQDKIGQPIAQIHQPVPRYAEKLERPVNHFFDRLQTGFPGYRLNWSIVDSPDLFLEPTEAMQESEITPENAGDRLWLRVERQTLRRLEQSGGILFTIRTHLNPLGELVGQPIAVRGLAAALRQMPEAMQQYKSLLPFRAALLRYLDRLSQ